MKHGIYPGLAIERAMKIQEVILRAISKQMSWLEAADIIGVSPRTMRRWRWRYEQHGYDGLIDRRARRPGERAVPLATVEQVLSLYRERYGDFNVRHFHERLKKEHGIALSYTWVKNALQGAGLVGRRKKRGPHRQRRERRAMEGMLVHCDGSEHVWLPGGVRHDLIAFLDDATSKVLAAYLVEEEGTLSVMAGLRSVLERAGLFCALYTDRGSHFFHTPKAGGAVDKNALTQIGRALAQLGIEHIPSYCPQGRGRMERFFGTWQGRLPAELRAAGIQSLKAANRYIGEVFLPWHNASLSVPAREPGSAFVPCHGADLEMILSLQEERIVAADNTVTYGGRVLQLGRSALRCSFAKCRVKVCEHLDGSLSVRYGPHELGRYDGQGQPLTEQHPQAA